jgi:hypothetical protein
MLALIDRALRVGRLEQLMLEARFGFFALRDELRLAAIDGEVPHNRWFDYLDTSITKAIDALPHINAWEALALLYNHSDDESIIRAQQELYEALAREENQGLKKIYTNYLICILELLVERHRTLGRVAFNVVRMRGRVVNLKDKLAKIFTVAPETSTLLEHH